MSDIHAASLRGDGPELHLVEDKGATIADAMDAFAALRFENARLLSAIALRLHIAPTDFRALFFIAGHDAVTPKRVAEHLGLTTGAMTSLVDRLENAGLAARVANPDDRRSLLVELSDQGRAAVASGGQIYNDAFETAIPAEHLDVITAAFAKLAEELGSAADTVGREATR